MLRRPPRSTLFPYTPLSRSDRAGTGGLLLQRRRRPERPTPPADQLHPAHNVRPAVIPKTSDRKSTRLNSSHANISYAVFCLKKIKLPYFGNRFLAEAHVNTF